MCHLEAALGLRQAHISQHLMVLRETGLVVDRREGWNIYYRVSRPGIFAVIDLVAALSGGGEKRASRRAGQVKAGGKRPCPCPKCSPDGPIAQGACGQLSYETLENA